MNPLPLTILLSPPGIEHLILAPDLKLLLLFPSFPQNMNRNGLQDMTDYSQMRDRAWYFRSVGFGHDQKTWADIISTHRLYGYDYVVSIEHEDSLMSIEEGFTKAVENLKPIMVSESIVQMWWT